MSKIKNVLILVLFMFSQQAIATKCFKENGLVGIKKLFPVVIKGRVVESVRKSNQSVLKVQIVFVEKGKIDQNEIETIQYHFGKFGKQVFEVNKSYYFPVITDEKTKKNSIVLPADGCPSLPAAN